MVCIINGEKIEIRELFLGSFNVSFGIIKELIKLVSMMIFV